MRHMMYIILAELSWLLACQSKALLSRKLSCKTNLLMWAGLRHSIPINLKLDTSQNFLAPTPILKI